MTHSLTHSFTHSLTHTVARETTTGAIGSGASTFYNTAEESESNTHMTRDFEQNTFVIHATRDIRAGDELLHVYKSKGWRRCFSNL